jgi:hypothetical protein
VKITPQGVFQLREWVSGPFGLLNSLGRRFLQPHTCGPAIRCSKADCNVLHHILMQTSETDSGNAYRWLVGNSPRTSLELSEKLAKIENPGSDYYRINHPGGLPWLIGNGFTHEELCKVAEDMLANNISGFRERVNEIIGGSTAKKSPTLILNSLSDAALIQLLLLLDDIQLTKALETAIETGAVWLSSTEVRRSFENRHLNGGHFRVDAEAARLGVRFIPRKANLTEPRMLALIKAVFSNGHERELSWQLRNEAGGDSLEKLENCAEEQDPRELLRRLLFSSQEALERAFSVLEYGRFSLPETEEGEKTLIEKILWKLGGPLPVPEPPQAALERHAKGLSDSIIREYADTDARINSIRSVGMSMFVALEELLQKSSEFACWSLFADHYDLHPLDRFRYSKNRASAFSCKIFSDASSTRGASFPYDPMGKNTLSVLISSFRVLAELCESYLENEQDHVRADWQIPDFSKYNDIQSFPLRHTALFIDLRSDSQQRLMDSLRAVTLILTRTDVCEIRNGLGHPRETFPSNDKLIEAIRAIRNATNNLAVEGLIPIVRQFAGEAVDKFRRRRIRMSDGYGHEIVLNAPNQMMTLGLPSYLVPQVIVQDAFLAGSHQPVRFRVADDSEWAELWHDVGVVDSWFNRSDATIITDELISNNPTSDNSDMS